MTLGQQQVLKEGQSAWVIPAVISRASFWRILRNGKSYFTMMSLHINSQYAEIRGISKNLSLSVRTQNESRTGDKVAGDFHGAAWRRRSGNDQRRDSTVQEAFANCPIPHDPTALLGSEAGLSKNGPMCTVPASHLVPILSGIAA